LKFEIVINIANENKHETLDLLLPDYKAGRAREKSTVFRLLASANKKPSPLHLVKARALQ
jgi:hypothetical protein